MFPSASTSPSSPPSLAGYRILATLNQGILVCDSSDRRLVLKRLPDDCLLRGQLHASIRQRLARIRELPHTGVANLHGVERDPAGAYLVWDSVPGVCFDEFAAECLPGELERAVGRLIHEVQSLHQLRLVHGALHGRNVIVRPDGAICLTHLSPLLYDDPADDVKALVQMLRRSVSARSDSDLVGLNARLAEVPDPPPSLPELAARLSAQPALLVQEPDRSLRWRSFWAAAAVAVLGAGLAVAILIFTRTP